jgi:hypothetical protein
VTCKKKIKKERKISNGSHPTHAHTQSGRNERDVAREREGESDKFCLVVVGVALDVTVSARRRWWL